MKIIQGLVQKSPEWLAHRKSHFNASDAPAMMGCSPYETRSQLLHRMATGIDPDVDAATQRRFDDGHKLEALARPAIEELIGDELFPVTGTNSKYSASFDGLTMDGSTSFEHKTLNKELHDIITTNGPDDAGAMLPLVYRVQMEHQHMVCGAQRTVFTASRLGPDGQSIDLQVYCWYYPDEELRAKIIAGWDQFAKDLAAYTPPAQAPVAVVANPVQALPAVNVQVQGSIAVIDNFAAFETALRDFLEHRLIRKPQTDQDFADLDLQIKAMKGAESALDSAEAQMLAQIQSIDTAKKTKDLLAKLVRDNRLMAEKLLTAEKERRKTEIVMTGRNALAEHVVALNQRLGKPFMPVIPADFAGAIKGMRSLESMENAVATALANAKIEANAKADDIDRNLRHLNEHAAGHNSLFADVASIVLKAPDDFALIVSSRISAHQQEVQRQAEAAAERERDRIRAEEAAKVQAEAVKPAPVAPVRLVQPPTSPAPVTSGARIKLGDINARIAPLSITADGLASLGFSWVATDKASKLYRESDFGAICAALIYRIESATSLAA